MLSRALVPLALACAAIAAARRRRWPQPRHGAAAAPPSEVRAWLLRIHDAASRRNFQGTFVVSGGGGVASARIAHFCDGPNQYERIESLDGRQRKVFRHNDVVHTLWPASQVAMIEQRGQLSSFPALLQAGDDAPRRAGTRCSPRAPTASPATRPTCCWSSRATRTATAIASGPTAPPGCCCAPTCSASAARCSRPRPSPKSRSACAPQPESVVQAMKKLDGYRVVAPGARRRPASRTKAGRCGRRRRASGSISCVTPADGNAAASRGDAERRAGAPDDLFRRPDLRLGVHRAVTAPTGTPSRCSSLGATVDLRRGARATGG